jgi:hypothetical protein
VLGGRHLKGRCDNQSNDGVGSVGGTGEAMRTSGTRGGGCLPIVLGGEWSDEKQENRECNGALDFDGSVEWRDATTNRVGCIVGGWSIFFRQGARRHAQGKDYWGGRRLTVLAFGLLGKKVNRTKFVVALEGHQSTVPHDNQPNKRGNDGGGLVVDGRLSGNAGGAAFNHSGAVELGGGRKYYKIEA